MSLFCFPWNSWHLKGHRVKILGHSCSAVVYLARNIDHEEIAVKTVELEYAESLQRDCRVFEDFHNCPEIIRCLGHEFTVESVSDFTICFWNMLS